MNAWDVATRPDGGEVDVDHPPHLGHFEIVGRLGAGGMGMVFEGRDTVLQRRVALKLLHPARVEGHIAPARLLREAQALAKLSHPNVVTVFEVGMAGDDPFVAMELVEGETLLVWMQQPRTWREVLDVFIAVGHGLVAVHALGLVHRDFKPSNVLIDRHGVPKLGDFGLVTTIDDPEIVDATEPASAAPTLTQSGSVLGTPAYMAPEQKQGLAVDARADQFSFAKSLIEALPEQAPAALQPILARALAELPADRYADMAPLLAALAHVRRGNRVRWIAAGATLAVVGAVAIAWGFGRAQSASEACGRPIGRLATVWNPVRREAIQDHLIGIDPKLGAQRFAVAASVLDRGGGRWLDQNVDSCRAARDNRQSGELTDRRISCLDRAMHELDETAAVLERTTDRATLDDAMKAAIALPTLDDCADVTALLELLPRPANPVQRAEADAVTKEVVEIDVALRTGGIKSTNVMARAQDAVTRARKLGDPETLARALRSLAGIQEQLEAGVPVDDTLQEAITEASAAHDDRLVAVLWSTLLRSLADQRRVDQGRTLLPAAEAALARSKSTTELYVKFLEAKSMVLMVAGDTPTALATTATAMKLLDGAGAASPVSPLHSLMLTLKTRDALARASAGQFAEAAASFRELIPLAIAELGADHPSIVRLHYNLAVCLRRLADNAGALTEFREAERVGEARLTPSPNLAELMFAVGSTLVAMNKQDEAIPILKRGVDMDRATLPAGDWRLADAISPLAAAYVDTKHYDEAKPLLDETIAIFEKRGTLDDKLGVAYANRSQWAVQSHHCDTAWADIDRGIAVYEAMKDPVSVYDMLIWRADCQVEKHQWDAALATTTQLMAKPDVTPEQHVLALFDHGEALWNLGRHAEGIAEVRTAHDTMEKAQIGANALPLATTWLATYQCRECRTTER